MHPTHFIRSQMTSQFPLAGRIRSSDSSYSTEAFDLKIRFYAPSYNKEWADAAVQCYSATQQEVLKPKTKASSNLDSIIIYGFKLI